MQVYINNLHIQFVKDHQSATDEEYWKVVDYVTKTVDQTSGRRALGVGQNFKSIFEDGRKLITEYLAKVEAEWKKLYEPAIKELLEKSKAANGQIKVDVKAEADTNKKN